MDGAARALQGDHVTRIMARGRRALGRGFRRRVAGHPDFLLANVVASTDGRLVVVDWAGSGRAPRLWSPRATVR
jgi:thiamine kinase-like enzyme